MCSRVGLCSAEDIPSARWVIRSNPTTVSFAQLISLPWLSCHDEADGNQNCWIYTASELNRWWTRKTVRTCMRLSAWRSRGAVPRARPAGWLSCGCSSNSSWTIQGTRYSLTSTRFIISGLLHTFKRVQHEANAAKKELIWQGVCDLIPDSALQPHTEPNGRDGCQVQPDGKHARCFIHDWRQDLHAHTGSGEDLLGDLPFSAYWISILGSWLLRGNWKGKETWKSGLRNWNNLCRGNYSSALIVSGPHSYCFSPYACPSMFSNFNKETTASASAASQHWMSILLGALSGMLGISFFFFHFFIFCANVVLLKHASLYLST